MEETNLPGTKKKGMSTGCIVGLVVVGVLIIAVLLIGFWCMKNPDTIVKLSMPSFVTGMKAQLIANPIDGVDTVTFDAVADGFLEKLGADEALDMERMRPFLLKVQTTAQNMENISADDVSELTGLMAEFYPDLKGLIPEAPVTDSVAEQMLEETEAVQ